MTLKEAKQIRKWRKQGTWRWVAARAADKWPDKGINSGNQIDGMGLCFEAAQLLGEDSQKPPWN